jgi:hypothetical protein
MSKTRDTLDIGDEVLLYKYQDERTETHKVTILSYNSRIDYYVVESQEGKLWSITGMNLRRCMVKSPLLDILNGKDII